MAELGDNENKKIGIAAICLGIYFLAMPFDSFSAFGIGSLTKIFMLLPITAIILERNTKLYWGRLSKILFIYLSYFTLSIYDGVSFELVSTKATT